MKRLLGQIRENVSSEATYQRGCNYYEDGAVEEISTMKLPDGTTRFSGRVRGTSIYHPTVSTDKEGRVDSYSCNCPAISLYDGYCKHIVAMLLAVTDMRKQPQVSTTSSAASALIRQYVEKEQSYRPSQELKKLVHLEAHLVKQHDAYYLKLFLGREKLYVVRSFSKLLELFENGEDFEYGKHFHFIHTFSNIEPSDRSLLRTILECCSAAGGLNAGYYYGSKNIGGELEVTPWLLDKLVDSHIETDKKFILRGKSDKKRMLEIVEENPKLPVQIEEIEEEGIRLVFSNVERIDGIVSTYMIQGDTLYKTDHDYKEAMGPLLDLLQNKHSEFDLAKRDIQTFFYTVYPRIEQFVELEGNCAELEAYLPHSPEFTIRLDAQDANTIFADLEIRYGEDTFNPIKENPKALQHRKFGDELRFVRNVEQWFPEEQEGTLYLQGDDEEIYHFLEDAVPYLSELAEIEISDRLARMGKPVIPKLSFGISIQSELLELNVDAHDLPMDELKEILNAYKQKRKYFRLKDGTYFNTEENTGLQTLAEISENLGLNAEALETGTISLPLYRAMYLDTMLKKREGLHYNRNDSLRALIRNMKNSEDSNWNVPPELENILRTYQKNGYRFLRNIAENGFHGLLADDMGLGKTLQIIALLRAVQLEQGSLSALVVCPASLVLNWESEFNRFCPEMRVTALVGTLAERKDIIANSEGYEVLISSYDQLKRDILCYENLNFDYQIIDEAQMIKNANTKASKSVKLIQSSHRFALTGTPVENRLSELWSIFDFLMPGYFFSYPKFKERYEVPAIKDGDARALENVQKMAAPFLLRRMKSEVLKELPPKTESVRAIELQGEQKKLYTAALAEGKESLNRVIAEGELEKSKLKILALLTRLRQICCDPSLCYEDYKSESGKLELCMELVSEAIEGGHKVLLFSQFTSMLDIIRERFQKQGISSYTIQGSTTKEKRQELVGKFQRDSTNAFLISLKAGGLGLNLTAADVVILYDPWWNTAAENQAADRAYRMGQKNHVQVIRLIAAKTIEEKIIQLQKKKTELAEGVISGGTALQGLTEADWQELLDI